MAKRSLLLVDSDMRSLRVLEVSLKKAGFNVTTASTGVDALEKVRTAQPDLVISDTDMPEMDGFEFCRSLKARPDWAAIPFIFLTGHAGIEHKIRGLELGVEDYLTKPIYIKEILTRVRILLQRQERASLEREKGNQTRFSGQLSDMGVVDLIQTIEVSRKSGLITIRADSGARGVIYFRKGRVIDAEAGRLVHEEAMYRILTWGAGEFEVVFRELAREAIIETSSQALLMEGMRRLDEWGRLQEQLPPLETRFEVDYDELWVRLAELPDDLNKLLRLFDGRRTIHDIIDLSEQGDLECLELVSKFFFEGIIIEAGQGKAPEETEATDLPLDGLLTGASAQSANLPASDGAQLRVMPPETAAPASRSERTSGLIDVAIGMAAPLPPADLGEGHAAGSNGGEAPPLRNEPRTTLRGMPVGRVGLVKRPPTAPVTERIAAPARATDSRHEAEAAQAESERAQLATEKMGSVAPSPEAVEAAIEAELDKAEEERPGLPTDRMAAAPEQMEEESPEEEAEYAAVSVEGSAQAGAEAEADAEAEAEADAGAGAGGDAGGDAGAGVVPEPAIVPPRGLVFDPAANRNEFDDDGPTPLPAPYIDEITGKHRLPSDAISSEGAEMATASGEVAADDRDLRRSTARRILTIDPKPITGPTRPVKPLLQRPLTEPEPLPPPPSTRDWQRFRPGLGTVAIALGVAVFAIVVAVGVRAYRQKSSSGSAAIERMDAGLKSSAAAGLRDAGAEPPSNDAAVVMVAESDASPPPPDAAPPRNQRPDASLEPGYRELYRQARRAQQRGRHDEALELVSRSLDVRTTARALVLRADVLLSLGEKEAALVAANRAVKLSPRSSQAWLTKGMVHYDLRRYDEAKIALERYLELRPGARNAESIRTLLDSL